MDVPFISSGALSRAHYALVRKIETAVSIPAADQVMLAEVETIRERLLHSKLSEKQTKECLILLLYCSMNLSTGGTINMDFALPHAVNLAEAGQTIQNRRTGYMYCAEMMPKEHELQLMLVNTLRKDLESAVVSRICLALEVLIQSPSEDVIPAVQDRLYELLSHNSYHVRRRALYTYQALSTYRRDILERVVDKLRQRLRDEDSSVILAALSISLKLMEAGLLSADKLRGALTTLLEETWQHRGDPTKRSLLVRILDTFRVVRPTLEVSKLLLEIVQACSEQKSSANVVLEQCFLAAGAASSSELLAAQSAAKALWVDHIRHLLVSPDVNEVLVFLTCLGCIEPRLWAGTTPDIPAVLEGWEVERVMQLLHSLDCSIRIKTLRILSKVDSRIVETYYTQSLQTDRTLATVEEVNEASTRLMEIIVVMHAEDGEGYAHSLRDVISALSPQSVSDKQEVLQVIVEDVLVVLREAQAAFRSTFLGVFFALLDSPQQTLGPTMTVILAALVCEYLDSSPVPPSRLLQGLAAQLPTCSAAIQDACVLSMIRLIASCDDIPEGTIATVRKAQEQGGRRIRRRCEQFLNLSHSRTIVQHIVSKSKSNSLPDFMVSLEAYEAEKLALAAPSPSLSSIPSPEQPLSRASSRASHTPGKLRYAAYDSPKLTSSLRRVRSRSPYSDHSSSSRFVNEEDPLSRTITAGDLALAAGEIELETLIKSPTLPSTLPKPIEKKEDLVSRVDLISLDSPFVVEPQNASTSAQADIDFKTAWDKLAKANMRGWCESSVEAVMAKLQATQMDVRVIAADQPPFQGDLKIVIHGADKSQIGGIALLHLKEGEDDSCMWHLRCEDAGLKETIGAALNDD